MNYNVYSDFLMANRKKRLFNFLIDLAAITLLRIGCGFLLHLSFDPFQFSFWLLNFLIFVYYYAIWEAFSGKTLGKLITKTKVIRTDGLEINTDKAVVRSLLRIIPIDPFTFLQGNNKGWHDRFSKTCVIDLTSSTEPVRPQEAAKPPMSALAESTYDHFVQNGYKGGYSGGHNNFDGLSNETTLEESSTDETLTSGYQKGDLYK
jgi:uncharacterized RDD family membrane protein YckC